MAGKLSEVAVLTESFVERMKTLLKKVTPRMSGNWLTINVTPDAKTLQSLKDDILELQDNEVGVRISFKLTKVNVRNALNKYELVELKPEDYISVDVTLVPDNFQIDKEISWTDNTGVKRTAKLNNFQLSIFRGFVEVTDLEVEAFDIE